MKHLLISLFLVFSVSCITAKTRDLSGVNLNPEPKAVASANNHFKTCVSDCTQNKGILLFCSDSCLRLTEKKTTIKVADYATCKHACEKDCDRNGCPSSGECHDICR